MPDLHSATIVDRSHSAEADSSAESTELLSGRSAKHAASVLHLGNLITILLPLFAIYSWFFSEEHSFAALIVIPILVIWIGASMLLYAIHRHHPNPKVGRYTKRATHWFFAAVGGFVVVGIFFPIDARYYLGAWLLAALAIVPWSIWNLIQIARDEWSDQLYRRDQGDLDSESAPSATADSGRA